MNKNNKIVSLGFTNVNIPAGTHICQIYSEDDERNDSLLKYLLQGLISKECNACFSDNITPGMLDEYLGKNGYSFHEVMKTGALSLNKTSDIYFKDGEFNPDQMLELLTGFYNSSIHSGFSAARVIGEMTPEVNHIKGGTRLLEYESRVSLLLKKCPVTAVCQYNAHSFDGATIMDVLKVHPMMVVRGAVVHNPFFIAPEEYLKGTDYNA
ncbi:MAG: MEDS domain-containing protein [Leptospiraceae bacterium]|nr:MEDS domain-containing protein [Leptospiraceae bacterium]MCP5496397.1 MEDS domain-containing protein [Leptospiraceae bacterium]